MTEGSTEPYPLEEEEISDLNYFIRRLNEAIEARDFTEARWWVSGMAYTLCLELKDDENT